MADPAAHEAREHATRTGQLLGSDVDNVEASIAADLLREGDEGAWMDGEVSLWGVRDV
jgi:hypothetical protein